MIHTKTWQHFTAAPHRVMFFGGAVQSLLVMAWWLFELSARYGLHEHPQMWAVAPAAAHAWLMIYGLFPFFMFGFLMTVFPRWMHGEELPALRYVPAFLLLATGALIFYIGLASSTAVLGLACILMLAGWSAAIHALWRVLRETGDADKRHAKVILLALLCGWLGQASYLAWLIGGHDLLLRFAIQSGIWLFLLPIFASVGHRMVPFFTRSALSQQIATQADWPWWCVLAGSAAHCLLQLAGAASMLWLSDLPMALAALYQSRSWGFRRSLRIPLLAVLHVGFGWIGIAMLLSCVQSIALLASSDGIPVLGLAPLHALTIGCFATLLIGMGTRVTLGHSGLPMQVSAPVQLMFAGIQLVALLRVLADVLPAQIGYWFYLAAAALWLACFAPWVLRYLPAYWRPRADGRPG